ncbi:DDRRRQL repeat protein YjdP [Cronobacter dublinensis]|uniref:DDRRRQL repeat protein YjdP n=1 Tax=Cronobacter dublinensis TaxID=413497 RepID=UPI0024C288E0|nr:DDRRRQL repeat protein YjdP [Cronobacter dublinensis]MDK1195953.1 DDRRRQL repeat protein YjdP [Cronobacter dublinensis]
MKSPLHAWLFAALSLSSTHALADGLDSVFDDTVNAVTQAINEAYRPDGRDTQDNRDYNDEDRTRYDQRRSGYDERRRRLEERHRQLDERQRRLDDERRRLEEEEQRLDDDAYR